MSRGHCTRSHKRRKLRALGLILGLALGAGAALPAERSANSGVRRINLNFNRANVEEAVERLSRAADVSILLRPLREDQGSEALQRLSRSRATFQWRNLTFADAFRDLRRRWSLTAGQGQDWGHVVSFHDEAMRKRNVIASADGPGWHAEVEKAEYSEDLAPPDYTVLVGYRLALGVDFQAPELDAGRIAGLRDLRATDGAGREYRVEDPSVTSMGIPGDPDALFYQLFLQGPVTSQKRLTALEGVVYEYAQFERSRLVVPIGDSMPGEAVFSADKRIRFSLLSFTPQLKAPKVNQPEGPVMRCSIGVKPNSVFVGDVAWGMGAFCPQLVTQSGVPVAAINIDDPNATRHAGGHVFPGVRQEDGYEVQDYDCRYPRLSERPAKVRLCLVRKRQPRPRMGFRIENIPVSPRPRQGS
jgi:hypothetical protein